MCCRNPLKMITTMILLQSNEQFCCSDLPCWETVRGLLVRRSCCTLTEQRDCRLTNISSWQQRQVSYHPAHIPQAARRINPLFTTQKDKGSNGKPSFLTSWNVLQLCNLSQWTSACITFELHYHCMVEQSRPLKPFEHKPILAHCDGIHKLFQTFANLLSNCSLYKCMEINNCLDGKTHTNSQTQHNGCHVSACISLFCS